MNLSLRSSSSRILRLALWLIALSSITGVVSLSAVAQESHLAELLTDHCLECHQGSDAQGGLDLSHRSAVLRGGDSGPAFDLQRPDESLIRQRVLQGEMPPEKQLTPEQQRSLLAAFESIEAWPETPIDPLARTTTTRAGYDWWSLAELREAELPELGIDSSADTQHPIDRFVLAKLQQHGLKLSERASDREQVRRLFFDLTGLPPTFADVEAFAADPSDQAWLELVERLLASEAYAERSAQHWLDIARFGESQGFEYNEPRYDAWPYRDWVIRAFESDMPYDKFVQWQLAGDLLEPNSLDGAAAVGFLVSGIHNTVIGRSAVMQATNRHAELEEIAAVTSQAFLGLTIHCARCHDHKFDPIKTTEYYQFIAALDGVTHGSRLLPATSDSVKRSAAEERRRDLSNMLWEAARARGAVQSTSSNSLTADLPESANLMGVTYRVSFDVAPTVWAGISQATHSEDAIRITLRRTDGSILVEETITPGAWPSELMAPEFLPQQVSYLGDGQGSLSLHLESTRHEGRFGGAIDNLRLTNESDELLFAENFDTLEPHHPAGIQAATGLPVHFGMTSRVWTHRGLNAIHAVERSPGNFALQLYGGSLDAATTPEGETEIAWAAEIAAIDAELRNQTVFTVVSQQPSVMRVLQRGDAATPTDEVSPGALLAVASLSPDFGLPNNASDAERRLALAQWMTHSNNGPFHRVIVNRIWGHHFGRGLVETPSDLGWAGGQPSHPELLEWLAFQFRADGLSIKRLHRLIVTSETYRQSSRAASTLAQRATEFDSDNRWLWRQNPRRLDAETVRDSMLEVAGRLNRERFGPGFQDVNIEAIGAAHYYRPADRIGAEFERRSLYRWRPRGERSSLLEAFDCPDPSVAAPVRSVTTTPTQALSLWNHAFVIRMADATADRIQNEDRSGDVAEHIERAWQLVLAREPSDAERTTAIALVEQHGLSSLCRVMFNLTETVVIE